jgi:hypothetical protein
MGSFSRTESGESPEGERVGRHARVQELDLDRSVLDAAVLAHELIEPLPRDRAAPIGGDIGPMIVAESRLTGSGDAVYTIDLKACTPACAAE